MEKNVNVNITTGEKSNIICNCKENCESAKNTFSESQQPEGTNKQPEADSECKEPKCKIPPFFLCMAGIVIVVFISILLCKKKETVCYTNSLQDIEDFTFQNDTIHVNICYNSEIDDTTVKETKQNTKLSCIKKNDYTRNYDKDSIIAISMINFNRNKDSSCSRYLIISKLNSTSYKERKVILERPGVWQLLIPATWECYLFGIILVFVLLLMCFSSKSQRHNCNENEKNKCGMGELTWDDYKNNKKYIEDSINLQFKKQSNPLGLLLRDFGSLAYDGSSHNERAEVREYRGFLSWHRDVTEKMLSIFLVIFFSFYLVRILKYFMCFINGETWYLTLMPIELNFVLSLIGFSIIVDGFIIFAAMTDAPGIGKILDSMIVILAGVVLLLVEATPGDRSIVAFSVSNNTLLIGISGIISLLFMTKWIVKHHTIRELIGKEK